VGSRVRWGQCFLVDGDAARRIVVWAGIEGLPVVEIGPGRGALTGLLRERASRLTLVEIDPLLAAGLRERFEGDAAVDVIEGDALRVDWAARVEPGFTVVANLPYESGTAIVASLLAMPERVREIVVMLQREVVERLTAPPGSRTYGGLSVLVQMAADVERGMVLAPRAFRPRPRVESQMVRLRPLAAPRLEVGDAGVFRDVVRTAFGQRRKMLRNTLGRRLDERFGDGAAARVFEAAGVDGEVRPEQLGLVEFAALSRGLCAEIAAAGERAGAAEGTMARQAAAEATGTAAGPEAGTEAGTAARTAARAAAGTARGQGGAGAS
jgi:16S rRNA (adenine1518-N6/adenine1519-N6)-dimethyltransferase